MRILGLDIGSSSVKSGVYAGRRMIGEGRAAYVTHFDGVRVEIVPADLLAALRRAAVEALGGSRQGIDAIAFCAFSPGVVLADPRGKTRTNIITHADRRSTATAKQLVTRHGKAFWLKQAGNLPYPGSIGASTLAFLRKESPSLFRNGRIGQVSSLIAGALMQGGKQDAWVIDPSQATFLGLYDIRRGTWNEALCAAVGVNAAALPRIMPADAIIGTLGPLAARALGIAEGTPIVGGFVDTSAAVIQTPMRAGQLAHNAGSTDVLALCLDKPRPAEGILTRPVGTGALLGGHWLAVRTIASSGSAMQWVKETLFRDLDDGHWRTLVKRCATAHPDADHVPLCVPTFAGERAAIEQPAGAMFSMLRLGTTREAILQSAMAGLVRASAENYRILATLHRLEKTVYATGGANALGAAMHKQWTGKHRFEKLPADNLAGLVMLAERVLR